MEMIAHQAPGVHLPIGLLTRFGQRIQEQPPVLVVRINRLPPVPSVHHVIDRSRILNSKLASHNPGPRLSPHGGAVKARRRNVEKVCSDPDSICEWTVLAAGAVWLWLLLLAVLQWRPSLRPALRTYVFSLAILAAVLCVCVAAALRETRFTRTAIVITSEAIVRYGPLAESPTAFK